MIKYPLSFNPIIDYYNKISNGEVIVSNKVKRIYKKLVTDIHDTDSIYEYSPQRANHAIEFIEKYCKHSKGKWAGTSIVLELWQKAFVAAIFGFVHKIDGTRKHREIFLVVARKNGKSTLSSAIMLYMLVADGEGGPEVFAVGTKEQQAKIVWQDAKRMVKKSPVLLKRIKPLVKTLIGDFNDSVFMPLGSDSDTLDGLNVHAASLDEIHAWKDKNLYDVIVDGTSAREQPLILMITTAGTVREAVYDMKYDEAEMLLNGLDDPNGYRDDRFLPVIYELDDSKSWTNPNEWVKANPALGSVKKIDNLQTKVNKAIANPLLVRNLLTKDFNIRSGTHETWLTYEQLNNTDTFDIEALKPRYCVVGIDLGATTDLTCATVLFRVPNDETIYIKQMYWLPTNLLEKRTHEDKIPYTTWYEQGLLRVSGENRINYKDVTEWLLEIQNELDIYIYKIGYDSWSSTYLVDELETNFGKGVTEAVIQGAKTFSSPMRRFASDLEVKKINYNNNPLLKWNLSNAAITVDRNDNIALVKTSNQRRRIDGVASLLDAYIVYEKHYDAYMTVI